MILSMTGFGTAGRSQDGIGYTLEIRSLNNRYFKAAIKLPETLQFLETEVERMIRSRLGRGSISYTLRLRNQGESAGYEINTAALERYVGSICGVKLPEGVRPTIDLATISALPGVFQEPEMDDEQLSQRTQVVQEMTTEAIVHLLVMRRAEG